MKKTAIVRWLLWVGRTDADRWLLGKRICKFMSKLELKNTFSLISLFRVVTVNTAL